MSLSSTSFRLIEYRAGPARVLTPAEPLTHTFIVDRTGDNDFFIFSNRQDLQRLGWLWSVAARCRGSLIYLPTRKNPLSHYLKRQGLEKGLDLVLLHHHLQFPLKDWKRIRSRLKRGKLHSIDAASVRSDIARSLNPLPRDFDRLWHERPHDRIHAEKRFETLFLVGSFRVFRYMIGSFIDLARTGPRFSDPGRYHDHVHLDSFLKTDLGAPDYISLTVDYYDQKLWGE